MCPGRYLDFCYLVTSVHFCFFIELNYRYIPEFFQILCRKSRMQRVLKQVLTFSPLYYLAPPPPPSASALPLSRQQVVSLSQSSVCRRSSILTGGGGKEPNRTTTTRKPGPL
jgi:hypothetical protein